MEKMQLLLSVDPNQFMGTLRTIMEEVVDDRLNKILAKSKKDGHSDRPLLKATEVCAIFKVSKPTLYEWLRSGKIPSIKIRSRRYFHWQDVEMLIQKSKV